MLIDMRFLCCLTITLIHVSLWGQVKIEPGQSVPRGIKMGITGGPGLAFQHHYYTGTDTLMFDFADYWNKLHNPKTGFAIGLSFQLPLSNSSQLDAGVVYAEKSFKVVSSGNVFWPDSNFIPGPQDPKTIKSLYKKHFIDIPIHLSTSIGARKLHWTIGAGVVTHFFLNEKYTQVIVQNNGNKVKNSRYEDEDYHFMNFSASVKLGLEYAASDRLLMQLTPTFQYGLFEIINMPVTAKIHQFGLNFTCYYLGGKNNIHS